jgi:cellulose synthase/poly-beta-1,6-N-acetylglucosamine synthase-like glycosyltransferase
MALLIDIFMIACGSIGLLYLVCIASFSWGWARLKRYSPDQKPVPKVAVLIPARNEENNIEHCIKSILAQDYPEEMVEIIVIDDSSVDGTAKIVETLQKAEARLTLVKLPSGVSGKKEAISAGIHSTDAELIITTDADCTAGRDWIRTMVACCRSASAAMVVGPVAFREESSTFAKMQSLELMALSASSGGSLYYGIPLLCSGANLCYTKRAFLSSGGYEPENGPSGDDVHLMYKLDRMREKIVYLKDKSAIVYTNPSPDLHSFYLQRKRWASKPFASLNKAAQYVSLIIFFFNFLLLSGLFLSGFASIKAGFCLPIFLFCLILLGIKCLIDFLLLFLAASFFDKKHFLLLFLPQQLLYMFYVIFTGMMGRRRGYTWKGRKINH